MSTLVLRSPLSRSLLLHLMLLALAAFFALIAPPLKLNLDEAITIDVIEPSKQAKTEPNKAKSIVMPTEGEEVKEAAKDSFLSDKNRVVREEKVAKSPGESSLSASSPQIAVVPKPKSTETSRTVKLSDLGVKIAPAQKDQEFEKERNWAESRTGEAIKGGEYVQGIKEGEVSALNTKEFVFYSYFARVRRQLDQSWQPLLREQIGRIYKHGRHLASHTDFVTRTLVTLNERGEVSRVQLLEESGTKDLDKAALDALNKAGPYPNPPKGLIEETGEVQIRWDFILKT